MTAHNLREVTVAPGRSAVDDGIVGRDAELAAIERWLDDAGASKLLIEGDAGIGKTTLVRAAIEGARAAGMEVLVARPTQAEAALSFVALGDLLDGVIDEVLEQLPQPQRQALQAAVDVNPGDQINVRILPFSSPPSVTFTRSATVNPPAFAYP
jgi:predicted ATPase